MKTVENIPVDDEDFVNSIEDAEKNLMEFITDSLFEAIG